MSAWDETIKIGKNQNRGGSDRPSVVKGRSAINQAARSGSLVSEKKQFGTANKKNDGTGQFLTKVANDDDIVKPKTVGAEFATSFKKALQYWADTHDGKAMTDKELATKCNTTQTVISGLRSGNGKPDNKLFSSLERTLNFHLRGANAGTPKPEKKSGPAGKKGAKNDSKKETTEAASPTVKSPTVESRESTSPTKESQEETTED